MSIDAVAKNIKINYFLSWLIYLIIFSLPLYLLRFKIFFVPTNVLEVMIWLLFLVWLIDQLKNKQRVWLSFLQINSGFILPIFLIWLGFTLATWFSADLQTSAGIWRGWLITPLLFLVLFLGIIKTPQQLKNVFISLFISGVAVALIVFFYWLTRHLTYDSRLRAFYLSANHLAMFLAPLFILSFYLWSLMTKKSQKIILALGQALMLIIIFLTYSLGAWFGLLASAIFFIIIYRENLKSQLKNKKAFFLILFISLILLILLVSLIWPHLSQKTAAFQSRLVIWQVASEILKDSPKNFILGIGPGLFQEYYLAYQGGFPAYPEWAVPQPHNLFLAFWLQTGLIGLLGLTWLLIVFFRKNLKPPISFLQAVVSAVMVYIIVHGLIDTTYWKNDLSLIFWLMIGITMIIPRINSGT